MLTENQTYVESFISFYENSLFMYKPNILH